MTNTPQSVHSLKESLNESWFEVNPSNLESSSKLLNVSAGALSKQKCDKIHEGLSSYQSSLVESFNFDSISPASPGSPESPIFIDETPTFTERSLLNKINMEGNRILGKDWIYDWTINDACKKELISDEDDKKSRLNLRQWAIRTGLFSKEVLSLLLLTNILSLVVGAGISYSVTIRRSL